jgi:hypothetical protein
MSAESDFEKAYQLGVLHERERCVDVIEGRAIHHNGPKLLTLELNQLAAVIKSGLNWVSWSKNQ